MAKLNFEEEKDAVDFVTNCMVSLDFLKVISDVIFSENRDKVTVGRFYDDWLKASGAKQHKIPFNLGAIVAYLYCGLLLTKELWYDLVPNEPVESADPKWQLGDISFSAPKQKEPTARYVLRRLRNSLGHGTIRVNMPKDLKDKSELMGRTIVCFHDENLRDAGDVFDAEATLDTLAKLVRTFQGEVHKNVRERIDPIA